MPGIERCEWTYRIWPLRSNGHGSVLRIREAQPVAYSGFCRVLRAGINLWVPAGGMAIRPGRGCLVYYRGPEMVDRFVTDSQNAPFLVSPACRAGVPRCYNLGFLVRFQSIHISLRFTYGNPGSSRPTQNSPT